MIKLAGTIVFFAVAFTLHAQQLSFADPLGDHMVVQQNKPFKIWGQAEPGSGVAVFADWMPTPVRVISDDKGWFMGIIPVPEAKAGDFTPHIISIETNYAKKSLEDVLIGEVWICSGQSNMQFAMHETIDADKEIPKADKLHIRLFSAGLNFSNEPVSHISGEWRRCTTETVKGFSAVAYHFGNKLFETLNIPVGIIFTGIGASTAQAYVPRETLAADPLLDSVYLQPYLRSERSKEIIDGGFTFEKVTRPYLLYNAIIHPFTNLSIRGFCWYQGESNRHERAAYTHLMYRMISSWRDRFAQGNLPFYYVQVAPYFYDVEDPAMADYAFFREAQEKISALGNTEMVVTMDVGEAKDLHPKNKKPIGIRLAKTALNRTYGMLDVQYQGPTFDDVRFIKGAAIVSFEKASIKGGLQTNDGKAPEFFQLAGKDRVFYPAEAEISGDRIVVRSKDVKKPVAVRYAFTNYPVTNLENAAGIPAVPFRTDTWEEEPVNR